MLIDFMLVNISKRVKSFPPTGLGKRYGIDETAAVCSNKSISMLCILDGQVSAQMFGMFDKLLVNYFCSSGL